MIHFNYRDLVAFINVLIAVMAIFTAGMITS